MSITKPRMVFASALTINRVISAVGNIDSVRDIVLIGRQTPGPLPCTVRRLSDFISQSIVHNKPFIPARVNPEKDPCLILCSSGTTGLPKGVELTSLNFLQFIFVTKLVSVLLTKFESMNYAVQVCLFEFCFSI